MEDNGDKCRQDFSQQASRQRRTSDSSQRSGCGTTQQAHPSLTMTSSSDHKDCLIDVNLAEGTPDSSGFLSDNEKPSPAGMEDSDSEFPSGLQFLGLRLPRSYLLWLVNAFNAWRLWLFLTAFSLATGVFSSTVIIANNWISLGLLSARYNRTLALEEMRDWPDFALYVLWWVASVVPFVMLSCLLVQLYSPIAAGSGIPELRCYLSRSYRDKSLLGGAALLTRVLGLILALNSGLPVGMLGPNVHMSCCIAHLLMFGHRLHRVVRPDPTAADGSRCARCLRAIRVLLAAAMKTLQPWTSDHLEMMCVAAAVGVACTFNAPISGVLFSIELTTKYFAVNTYWRGFYCNIVATMTMSILMTGMRRGSIAGEYLIGSAIAMAKSEDRSVQSADLASFAGLGLLAGLVSVGFLRFYQFLLKTVSRRLVMSVERRIFRLLGWGLPSDSPASSESAAGHASQPHVQSVWYPRLRALAYCLCVSLCLALLTCPAHRLGRGSLSQVRQFDQLRQLFAHTSWRRQLLGDAEGGIGNATTTTGVVVQTASGAPAAAAAFSGAGGFTSRLRPGGDFAELMLLLLHFASLKLLATALTLTLAIPTGVFMPTFVAGAAIGRLYGELTGHDHPVWFVLAGAAAFSGAATGTLSTSLIVFEATGDISLIIPTILSVLIANFAMHVCRTLPFYDLGIRLKRLPHAPITCPKLLARCSRLRVRQVMLPPDSVVRLSLTDTNDALRRLLRRHPNFESVPLVQVAEDAAADDTRPILVGQVSLAAAHRYLRRGLSRACAAAADTAAADEADADAIAAAAPEGLAEQLAVLDSACDLRVLGAGRLARRLGLGASGLATGSTAGASLSEATDVSETDEDVAWEGNGNTRRNCDVSALTSTPLFVHRCLLKLSAAMPHFGSLNSAQEIRTRAFHAHLRSEGIPRWAEFLRRRVSWGRGVNQLAPSEVDVTCGPDTGLDRAQHLHSLVRQRQLMVTQRGRLVSVLPAGNLYRGLRRAFLTRST